MATEKPLATVKRFGVRYGRRVRHKLAQIESIRFAKKKCPYCHAWRVKRLSAGIWFCNKCSSKFTGKAYNIAEKIIIKEEIVEGKEPAPQEKETGRGKRKAAKKEGKKENSDKSQDLNK